VGDVTEVGHCWISEDARLLYEAYEKLLREVIHKRSVDLGIAMDDGDEQTATALLKQNRKLRMSEKHHADALRSWHPIVDVYTKKMAEIFATNTMPLIVINKAD
jgi:hypothetical protein